MYLLSVQINFLNQLRQIEPDRSLSLINSLEKAACRFGCCLFERSLFFPFSSSYRESAGLVVEAVKEMEEILRGAEDFLHGYSLIIIRDMETGEKNLSRLEYLQLQVPFDNSLWIDRELLEDFVDFIEYEHDGLIHRITGLKEKQPQLKERFDRFFHIDSWQNEMEELFEKPGRQILNINAPDKILLYVNVLHFLEKNFGKENVVTIFPSPLSPEVIEPLYQCYRFHNTPETEISSRFFTVQDRFADEFTDKFNNWLNVIAREGEHHYRQIVFYFPFWDSLSEGSRGLIARCLNRSNFKGNERILIHSDSGSGKNLWKSLKKINWSHPGGEQIVCNFEKGFPGYSQTMETEGIREWKLPNYLHYFHDFLMVSSCLTGKKEEKGTGQLLFTLAESTREVLYLLVLLENTFRLNELEALLEFSENPSWQEKEIIERLLGLGIIIAGPQNRMLLTLEIDAAGFEFISEKARQKMQDLLCRYLIKITEDKNNYYLEFSLKILHQYGNFRQTLTLLDVLCDYYLDSRQYRAAESLMDRFEDTTRKESDEGRILKNLLSAKRLSLRIRAGEINAAQKDFNSENILQTPYPVLHGDTLTLSLARYALLRMDNERSLELSKKALFSFQQEGRHKGECESNIVLALSLLGSKKVRTAIDYFEIARRISFQINSELNQITSSYYQAVSLYLFGNLPHAARLLEQSLDTARNCKRIDWTLILLFFSGRIEWDLGRYNVAEELFDQGRELSKTFSLGYMYRLFGRWRIRSMIYKSPFISLDEEINRLYDHPEKAYFAAEYYFFREKYEEGRDLLENYIRQEGMLTPENSRYLISEPFSAYSLVEEFTNDREAGYDFLKRKIVGFHALLSGLCGEEALAVEKLEGLMNTFVHADCDPESFLIPYFATIVKKEGNSLQNDIITMLSQAVKKLQARAGRFDDQQTKTLYLKSNYWNKRILDEAGSNRYF